MTYTPAWNAQFAKPLLNQLIAIIQRDQAAALAIVNAARAIDGNPALEAIGEFHKGPALWTAFPWLSLAIETEPFDPNVDQYRRSMPRIRLVLDSGNFDQESTQEDCADYAQLLDMIVTTPSPADWCAALPIVHETMPKGMTRPNATGSVKRVFVEGHHYGKVDAQGRDTPIMRVELPLIFELFEM